MELKSLLPYRELTTAQQKEVQQVLDQVLLSLRLLYNDNISEFVNEYFVLSHDNQKELPEDNEETAI